MIYEKDATYHIYNRSNDLLFYNRENYIYFLKKVRKYILPYGEILAYCLMPNHFHILLTVNEQGAEFSTHKSTEQMQLLPKSIGTLLSSYTQTYQQTGETCRFSLFRSHHQSENAQSCRKRLCSELFYVYSSKSKISESGRKD